MTAPDLTQLVDPWYWLSGFTGPATPYTYVILGLFAAVTVVSGVVWVGRRRLFPGHRVRVRLAQRLGPWFFAAGATGVGLMLLRVAESPILTARFLWLACGVWVVGMLVYLVRYLGSAYAVDVAEWQREEQLRQFIPRPKGRRRRR